MSADTTKGVPPDQPTLPNNSKTLKNKYHKKLGVFPYEATGEEERKGEARPDRPAAIPGREKGREREVGRPATGTRQP